MIARAAKVNFEAPLTWLVWITSILSIVLTYILSYLLIPELGDGTRLRFNNTYDRTADNEALQLRGFDEELSWFDFASWRLVTTNEVDPSSRARSAGSRICTSQVCI